MNERIKVNRKNVNGEIMARILKVTSQKYGCTMKIDFNEGRRISKFLGDEDLKAHIAEEVEEIFSPQNGQLLEK